MKPFRLWWFITWTAVKHSRTLSRLRTLPRRCYAAVEMRWALRNDGLTPNGLGWSSTSSTASNASTPTTTGTPSTTAVMAERGEVRIDYCDANCPQRATYSAFRDDMELTFCDHHTMHLVDLLVARHFHLHIIPGARSRSPVG